MENSSATVSEIWDLIKETRIDMKESRAEMKEFRANMEQFHVGMEELRASQKETDKLLKETAEQLKKTECMFTTQWGRLMESLVRGDLVGMLLQRGISVHRTLPNVKALFVRDDGIVRIRSLTFWRSTGMRWWWSRSRPC